MDGVIGLAEAPFSKEEWEEAVRVLACAFPEAGAWQDREVRTLLHGEVRDVDDRRHCAHLRATEFAANDMMTDVLESDEKSAVNVVLVCPGDNESQWSAALVSFRLG